MLLQMQARSQAHATHESLLRVDMPSVAQPRAQLAQLATRYTSDSTAAPRHRRARRSAKQKRGAQPFVNKHTRAAGESALRNRSQLLMTFAPSLSSA
jgi:hypothetical protein